MNSKDKDNNSSEEQEIVIDDEDKEDMQQEDGVRIKEEEPILDPQSSSEVEKIREELAKSKDMCQRLCKKAREQQLRIEHLEKLIDSKHDILAGKEQENDKLDEASRKLKELELKEINNDLEIEYYKGDALKKNELIGELRRKEVLANNKNGELSRKNLALLNEMDVMKKKEEASISREGELSRIILTLEEELNRTKKKEEEFISRESKLAREIDELKLAKDELCRKNDTLLKDLNEMKKKEEDSICREEELTRKNLDLMEALDVTKKREEDYSNRERELSREVSALRETLSNMRRKVEEDEKKNEQRLDEIAGDLEGQNQSVDGNLDWMVNENNDEWPQSEMPDMTMGEDFPDKNKEAPIMKKDSKADETMEGEEDSGIIREGSIKKRKKSSEANEVKWWEMRRSSRLEAKHMELYESDDDETASEPTVKKLKLVSKKAPAKGKKEKSSSKKPSLKRQSPRVQKMNTTALECPECEYRGKTAQSLILHLHRNHSTTLGLSGLALRCDCGAEVLSYWHSLRCNIANFTVIRKTESTTQKTKINTTDLECPKCEYRGKTAQSFTMHLRNKHSTTLGLAGLALRCDCGAEVLSYTHCNMCDIANFTVIRKREGPIRAFNDAKMTPQCVLCEVYPKTACDYVSHLRDYHKSSLKANGIFLICSCGMPVCSDIDRANHNEKCYPREYSLHKFVNK